MNLIKHYTNFEAISVFPVWNCIWMSWGYFLFCAPCICVIVADFKQVGSFSLCRKSDRVTLYKRTQLISQLVVFSSCWVCTFVFVQQMFCYADYYCPHPP